MTGRSLASHSLGPAMWVALVVMLALGASAEEAHPKKTLEDRAFAFGQLPTIWSPRLSPDGSRVVMVVQPAKFDIPLAVVGN